jgi:hypothetical protein
LNCRFDHIPGVASLQNFSKIVAVFLLILERKHERFALGAGVKSFFEFNFLPIGVTIKK